MPARAATRTPERRTATAVVALSYGLPRTGLPSSASFRRWVDAALTGAGMRRAVEVSIRIVGADEGRMLNRDYRNRDYATNVLSFPAGPLPAGGPTLLGDIALCAPVIASEAVGQGKRIRDHYAHLTVHGVLHLLGMEHESDADAERMEALETRILAALGIADPYSC